MPCTTPIRPGRHPLAHDGQASPNAMPNPLREHGSVLDPRKASFNHGVNISCFPCRIIGETVALTVSS